MFDRIIFDLDGTLVDSFHDIFLALQGSAVDLGIEPPSEVEVRRYMHHRLDHLVQALFPTVPAEEIMARFRVRYDGAGYPNTILFPGVAETIAALRAQGCKMYVATNKRKVAAEAILSRLDLGQAFDLIVTSDHTVPPLDKAQQIEHLIAKHGLRRERTLMVGDTHGDWDAADASKVRFILAAYGYGNIQQAEIERTGVTAIRTFPELQKLF